MQFNAILIFSCVLSMAACRSFVTRFNGNPPTLDVNSFFDNNFQVPPSSLLFPEFQPWQLPPTPVEEDDPLAEIPFELFPDLPDITEIIASFTESDVNQRANKSPTSGIGELFQTLNTVYPNFTKSLPILVENNPGLIILLPLMLSEMPVFFENFPGLSTALPYVLKAHPVISSVHPDKLKDLLPVLNRDHPKLIQSLPAVYNELPQLLTFLPALTESFPELKELLSSNSFSHAEALEQFPATNEALRLIIASTPDFNQTISQIIKTIPALSQIVSSATAAPEFNQTISEKPKTVTALSQLISATTTSAPLSVSTKSPSVNSATVTKTKTPEEQSVSTSSPKIQSEIPKTVPALSQLISTTSPNNAPVTVNSATVITKAENNQIPQDIQERSKIPQTNVGGRYSYMTPDGTYVQYLPKVGGFRIFIVNNKVEGSQSDAGTFEEALERLKSL